LLVIYFFVIILKYPLVGIEVKKQNQEWIIEDIYEKGWANNQPIKKGDVLKLVNNDKPELHSTVILFNRVEKARSVTIENEYQILNTYYISNDHLDFQFTLYLLLPFLFSLTMIYLSIFLYLKKIEDKSVAILNYFLLTLGLCYLSASTSARGDVIGRILTIITLPGSVLLFIHFLHSYFKRIHLIFIKRIEMTVLYTMYFTILMIIGVIYAHAGSQMILSIIQLGFFLLIICYLLFQLTLFYIKNKNSNGKSILKILLISFFSAFSPFIFLYVIPKIIFNKELVSAEITAVFLIIIPIVFVYLQIAEKLFDINFLLNRLRYYSLLSLPFTLIVVMMLKILLNIKFPTVQFVIMFVLIFLSTTLFLYLKEYVDYKMRHHLFSQKSNFDSSLYKFFQRAKYETKVCSLINNLINEIRDVLMVNEVKYYHIETEDGGDSWSLCSLEKGETTLPWDLEYTNWNNYKIGSLIELINGFVIIIGGDNNSKNIIFCGLKKFKTNLNIQERIWLETLAYISSILLENFQLIEDLFHKIEGYKEKKEEMQQSYPSWLSRLLFTLSEKERANLSVDLHDSVLQDTLQLLREIDEITEKVDTKWVKDDLFNIKERMLDNIHLIRETCNELRPPFLSELGIIQSLQQLFKQTKLRSNFILYTNIDSSINLLEKEYELPLYRVVQELLNNAMKHSEATEVNITLEQKNSILMLNYHDNGIGMDMSKLKDSFETIGLAGIKERVKSIGGTIDIYSTPGNGMDVAIEIKFGGDDT
jgi:two-component system, NarL family, sensor histidine kinase ComP